MRTSSRLQNDRIAAAARRVSGVMLRAEREAEYARTQAAVPPDGLGLFGENGVLPLEAREVMEPYEAELASRSFGGYPSPGGGRLVVAASKVRSDRLPPVLVEKETMDAEAPASLAVFEDYRLAGGWDA